MLEFENIDQSHYDAVNAELGLDSYTGEGDWPPGLVSHVSARTEGGGVTIIEVWESQELNAAFFEARLGPALAKVGVPPPSSMVWAEVIAHHVP
jgi:hypothetical protein